MVKIVDSFMFYNEFEMLKFRLEYLYNYVDYFVLIEAPLTHAGNPKEFYYENNKHLYEKYQDKIINVKSDYFPTNEENNNAWFRENLQRNQIDLGIEKLELEDNDIIIISDIDEIPDRNSLNEIRSKGIDNNTVLELQQIYYAYNLTSKDIDNIWTYSKMINNYTYKTKFNKKPNDIRSGNNYINININKIEKGGWHFSYFGNISHIKNKINNMCHTECQIYAKDDIIENAIKNYKTFITNAPYKYVYIPIEENDYLPEGYEELLKLKNFD